MHDVNETYIEQSGSAKTIPVILVRSSFGVLVHVIILTISFMCQKHVILRNRRNLYLSFVSCVGVKYDSNT